MEANSVNIETPASTDESGAPPDATSQEPSGSLPDQDPVPVTITIGELAEAVRFVVRERPEAVEAVLWAIVSSQELVEVCRKSEPEAHEYAEIAGLDGIVNAVLTTSEENGAAELMTFPETRLH